MEKPTLACQALPRVLQRFVRKVLEDSSPLDGRLAVEIRNFLTSNQT